MPADPPAKATPSQNRPQDSPSVVPTAPEWDTPTAEPTMEPTAEPTIAPTPPPAATVDRAARHYAPCPSQAGRGTPADLSQATLLVDSPTFQYVCQTWNNCGPATLTMDMLFFGWNGNQATAASFLKPDPEDKNVSPWQMALYAQGQGYGAQVRVGGTLGRIKALLAAGFPVLIEKGFDPEPERLGWMGHYGLIIGYSDPLQQVVVMDSYLGPDQAVSYADLEQFWKHFNYLYVVLYSPDQRAQVDAVLGQDVDDTAMYQAAMARAQEQTQANPSDGYAWFNLGTNLLALGDAPNAAAAFDQARLAGLPWRMLWYQFGPYEAYAATGRYDDMITLADSVINVTPNIEESFYYKGRALQAKGDTAGAREQYQTALRYNPNFTPASDALAALP